MNLFHALSKPLAYATAGCLLFFSLGCAGLSEWTYEAATGGSMEITDDGLVLVTEDGTRVVVQSGKDLEIAPDFPIPEPWPDAKPTTITTATPTDGPPFTSYTFDLERPTDELSAFYRGWASEQGITEVVETDVTKMGTRIVSLSAKDDAGNTIAIAINEMFGQNTLTLSHGDPESAQ